MGAASPLDRPDTDAVVATAPASAPTPTSAKIICFMLILLGSDWPLSPTLFARSWEKCPLCVARSCEAPLAVASVCKTASEIAKRGQAFKPDDLRDFLS